MNKKEWIVYFESVHGRKPTKKELDQASQNGTIVQREKPTKKIYGVFFAIISGLLLAFVITNLSQEDSSEAVVNKSIASSSTQTVKSEESSEKSSSTEESSSSHSTSSSIQADTPPSPSGKLNIQELAQSNFSSVQGTWRLGNGAQGLATSLTIQGNQVAMDNSNRFTPIKDTKIADRTYAVGTYELLNSGVPSENRIGYLYFFPAGVRIEGKETGDSSRDRIIWGGSSGDWVANGNSVLYREEAWQVSGVQGQLEARIEQYRRDINQSLQDRTDHVLANFTSASSPSYLEIRDYIVNQSAIDKVKAYNSRTKSLNNLRVTGDTATFDLEFESTTIFTDGTTGPTNTLTRHYVMKYIDNSWKIESF